MNPRLRLKDLAQACGLGVSTVSHALRGDGNVSRQTRDHVRKIAAELGYRPDPMLASLAAKRFRRDQSYLGLPIAYVDYFKVSNPFGKESLYHKTALKLGKQFGFHVLSFSLADYHADWERLLSRLRKIGVKGIIIGDIHNEVSWAHDWADFAVVACGRDHPDMPFDQVRSSIYRAARTSWQNLWSRGYRRIGAAPCLHERKLEDDASRISAFLFEQSRVKNRKAVVPLYLGEHHDRDAFLAWYFKYKPEAVIGFALHHYYYLIDEGLKCPEDFAFVALHVETALPGYEGISGMEQNSEKIVSSSLQLLEQKLRYHILGSSQMSAEVVIPFSWIEGATCPQKHVVSRSRPKK